MHLDLDLIAIVERAAKRVRRQRRRAWLKAHAHVIAAGLLVVGGALGLFAYAWGHFFVSAFEPGKTAEEA